MIPGLATIRRKIRSLGGRFLRRSGLLPGGIPDRIGDDEIWRDRGLAGEVVLFFPDTRESLYQLRPWYGPLSELHRQQGLTIICMDSKTAREIRKDLDDVPILTISQEAFLDELILASDIKIFLYVNYNQHNFFALRLRSVLHVSLLHGDSDKSVSISNQAKAFDFSFVSGQAAVDRFKRYTTLFDAEDRCVKVGRPQFDTGLRPSERIKRPEEPYTVLYAPTWEGGHDTVSYGSGPTHGLKIVASLVSAGLHVIYRPHPLTGQRLARYGEADSEIRRYLMNKKEARVSIGTPIAHDFAGADLLISDVSAVTSDWLVTNRPLIITRSSVVHTREATTKLLELVPRLTEDAAALAGDFAIEALESDPIREERLALTEYYFGDVTPGASMTRFLNACIEISAIRDREWAAISKNEVA